MRTKTPIVIAAAALVAVALLVGWYLNGLTERVADLGRQVEELNADLAVAERRADAAEEARQQAERQASDAEGKAAAANQREQASAERADTAEQARAEAERQAERSDTARRRAEQSAEEMATALGEAENTRLAAEMERDQARIDARSATQQAEKASAEAEELARRREEDLARLESALSRIAETRRTALGLVMSLDSDHIEFDFDRAELRPENRELLAKIAGILLTVPQEYTLQVFGHTDDVGTVEYNQVLSERRAAAVRNYLVEAGIDPAIISSKGMGKLSPLVEGTDAESRQRNRRVELAVVLTQGEIVGVASEDGN